jgi:hypothetical protein
MHERIMRIFGSVFLFAAIAVARTAFWAPVAPQRAPCSIDVKSIPGTSRLEGTETIRLRNDTHRPIGRIALDCYDDECHVRANGVAAKPAAGMQSVALFDLHRGVQPGGQLGLFVRFGSSWKLDRRSGSAIVSLRVVWRIRG